MKTNLSLIRKVACVTLCTLALSPAAMFAVNAPMTKAPVAKVEDGIIKSVDSKAHQLVVTDVKTKTDETFLWNDHTKFTESAKDASAAALKSGLPVHLTYTPGSGTPILERVQISPAKVPAAAPSAAPATHSKT
jgi:hypothetical protein